MVREEGQMWSENGKGGADVVMASHIMRKNSTAMHSSEHIHSCIWQVVTALPITCRMDAVVNEFRQFLWSQCSHSSTGFSISVASALSFTFSYGKWRYIPASQRRMEPSNATERFSVKCPRSNEENPISQCGQFWKPNPQQQVSITWPNSKQGCGRGLDSRVWCPWLELSSWVDRLVQKG